MVRTNEPPVTRKEALVIVNPVAYNLPGPKRRRRIDEWLREQGWQTEWVETERPGHARELSAAAAERGVPVVFVCAGDGTLGEAVNGLAGSETALGMIPGGISNLWAREIGLPRGALEAVQCMVNGEVRSVDLGKAGDHYFLQMAGYGIDGLVTRAVSVSVKGRLGASAYALAAVREALHYRPSYVELNMDGKSLKGDVLMVLAGNTQKYAGLTKVTPDARVDDGLLDVCVYRGQGKIDIVLHAARTLLRRHLGSAKVTHQKVRRMEFVYWERPLPLQVDGDAVDDSPTVVEAVPGALRVIVPRDVTTPIFSPR